MNSLRNDYDFITDAIEALEALGPTEDAILDTLRKQGIKGSLITGRISVNCVISKYLEAHLGEPVVTAGGYFCETADSRIPTDERRPVNREAIRKVQKAFDEHRLPAEFYSYPL